jgi:versiconal hemiacetal acetate esterase
MGGRFAIRGSPEEIKAQYEGLIQLLAPQLPAPSDAVDAKEGDIDGIKYRLYTPKEAAKSGPLPVGIWTHGGGFMTGDLNSDDLLCRVIAEHAPSIIVGVDYRLTPEHKAPTQLQDTLNVYKWARQNASSFGGDVDKFYTIGGSAGGALALQVANHIVKDPSKRGGIRGVAAMVPLTLHWDHVPEEYKPIYTAYTVNGKDAPIIDKESMRIFYEHAGVDPKDPDTFVALDKDNHKNFPPVYFAACERDPLRDDSMVMEAALKKAGVPTKLDLYRDLPHYFWIFASVPEGQQFIANLIGGVKWLISQM